MILVEVAGLGTSRHVRRVHSLMRGLVHAEATVAVMTLIRKPARIACFGCGLSMTSRGTWLGHRSGPATVVCSV